MLERRGSKRKAAPAAAMRDALAAAPVALSVPEHTDRERTRYRTIWISDIHLGTRGCNADMLIDFPRFDR